MKTKAKPKPRKLKPSDVVFTVVPEPEYAPVRGNALASGDDVADKACEDEIIRRLENDDIWAWCCVKVTARLIDSDPSLEGVDYLGCCSYADEVDFCTEGAGGYFDDMKEAALADLQAQVNAMAKATTR